MHFLLSYHITAHATSKVASVNLFLNQHVRTRYDLLHPSYEETVSNSKAQQKKGHDQHVSAWEFIIGQRVLVCNYWPVPRWLPGTIMSHPGPLTYLVQVVGNCGWKRHINQLLQTYDSPQELNTIHHLHSDSTITPFWVTWLSCCCSSSRYSACWPRHLPLCHWCSWFWGITFPTLSTKD